MVCFIKQLEEECSRPKPRAVTAEDFIIPKFRGKNPEDYEFRADGEIVRKDRWETGIHRIRNLLVGAKLLPDSAQFEITDVIRAVEKLIPETDE
jgi:hypothetical protein